MRRGLGLLLLLAILVTAATAQAAPRKAAAYWSDRALEASARSPTCAARVAPLAGSTDAPAPPDLLAGYGILRTPPTEPVPPLHVHDTGALAVRAARTRTVRGIQVTVTAMLNWRPYARSAACDAVERRALSRLLLREPSAAVRARARALQAQRIRVQEDARNAPPRTLLYLTSPNRNGLGITGTPERTLVGGLYLSTPTATQRRTFVGLIPDGVARIRYRAKGRPDVEAPVVDNLVVVSWSSAGPDGPALAQQVWLRADGSVVRTIGRLR